jgi:hypothetical protein
MKTLRNIALAALLLFVVAPCAYNQYFRSSAPLDHDADLFAAARAAAGSSLTDAVIVEGIRERAVCARRAGADLVYREDSKTLIVDDGRPVMSAALDGWCREKLGNNWAGRDLP